MNKIVAKKYGRNLVVVIDSQKMTKVINTDDDKKIEESIKNKILLYNKKNNESIKEQIISLINSTKSVKEKEIAERKGIKKAIKTETKKEKVSKNTIKPISKLISELEVSEITEDDAKKLQELINKNKALWKDTEIKPKTTQTPRRGEY